MKRCFKFRFNSFIIALMCLIICSQAEIKSRKLLSTPTITLKVNQIGEQYILNEFFKPLPNQILINGIKTEEINCKISITDTNSLIQLIWEDNINITSLHGMFSGLINISYINFTGFDTSQVTDMSNMFMGCQSLETVDLSGFDTSNVLDMSKMFLECTSLKNLQINF